LHSGVETQKLEHVKFANEIIAN